MSRAIVFASDETPEIDENLSISKGAESHYEIPEETQEKLAPDNTSVVSEESSVSEDSESDKEKLNETPKEVPCDEITAISGQVSWAISFTPEEAELYKSALNDTLKGAQEDVKSEIYECTDGDRADYFRYQLEELQKIDIDKMFEEQADGSIELKSLHRNAEVIIDGTEYRTDDEGYYLIEDETKIESVLEGENEVILADQNIEFAELEVSFDGNIDNNEIKYEKTFSEFADGMANMSEKMQNAEGQVVQVFYAKRKINDNFGAGKGATKVYKDTNIVGCNKHDKNLDSINTVQFATGNSDCAISVRLGLLSQESVAILYPYSLYCVEESLSEGNVENIYCNGKSNMRNGTSKNGHINCSWFKGIGHSESFHTHASTGTAPTTSPGSWNVTNHNAESKTISVMSSAKWEITNSPTWLSISPKSGAMGTSQVTINAGKNAIAIKRSGTISIKNSYGTKTFTVTQPANPVAPILTLSRTTWTPTYKAQTATATITTNQGSWSATPPASAKWLSCTKSGNTLTIKVTANTSASSRKATITVKAGNLSKTITVTQGASTLTLSRTSWTPTYTGQTATATITTNQSSWSATSPAAAKWLSCTKSGNTLTLKVTTNTSAISRKATITVKAGSLSKTITVTQGASTLTLSRTSWTPTYTGQTATATITTNQGSWSATYPTAAKWLSCTKSGNTLTIKVAANTSAATRNATITVKAGSLSKTITVTQGASTLTLSRTVWMPTYAAQTATAIINTNQSSWSATYPTAAKWLSCTKSGNTLTIKVAANTGTASRSATITVKAGSLSKTIAVTQGASILTLSRTVWMPTYMPQTTTVTINTNQSSWSATYPAAAKWLSCTKSGNTLTIKVAANTGILSRSATIKVKAGSLSKTITVKQSRR